MGRVCSNCGHPMDVAMDTIEWGGMRLDRPHQHAIYFGHSIFFTTIEFRIIERLVLACGEVVPFAVLHQHSPSLRVHLTHIRNKLRAVTPDPPIRTIYGRGCWWAAS